ncbi:MAG TPA: hypothetical protein VMC06_04970, partial [Opitutaceae bacterium]|nr:hypothetical protein [Opitutaceae bacterium]
MSIALKEATSRWAARVVEWTEQAIARGFSTITFQYVRPHLSHVSYTDGFLCFSHSEEIVTRPHWPVGQRDREYAANLENLPETAELIRELKALHGNPTEVALMVRKASRRIMEIVFEEGRSPHLTRCIEYFTAEVTRQRIPWLIKIGFSGVIPEGKLEFSTIAIWLTEPTDIERLYRVTSIAAFSAHSFLCPCTAHFSLEVFEATRGEAYWESHRVVALLALFGIGSVCT